MPALLTSKDNPLAKKIRLVASQARRAPPELVLAEGVRVLEEATVSGYSFEAVLISEKFGRAQRERALVSLLGSKQVPVYRAAETLLKSLSGVSAPQGALALVRVPRLTLDDVPATPNPLIVCGCGIQDPGNLGTLVRTAAAVGAAFVCTTADTVSGRNQKAIRSSAGAFFRIPVIEKVPSSEFITYCQRRSVSLLRADAREGEAYTKADFRKGTALLMGNEGQGMAGEEWFKIPSIRIPMAPGVESLNVAAAGAILLFEAYRQRSN